MKLRTTHTFAILEVSPLAYAEIASALREAQYNHAFVGDGVIDMAGIGVKQKELMPRFAVHYLLADQHKLAVVTTTEAALVRATIANSHEVKIEHVSIMQLERIDDR